MQRVEAGGREKLEKVGMEHVWKVAMNATSRGFQKDRRGEIPWAGGGGLVCQTTVESKLDGRRVRV